MTGLGETLADGIFFFMFSAGFLKTDKTKSMYGLLYDLLSRLAKAINTMGNLLTLLNLLTNFLLG